MDKTTLSYMAGFFDGEGSINITMRQRKKFSPEYTLGIAIGQRDGAMLDWVRDNFAGNVFRVKRDGSYFWSCSNQKAYRVLKTLFPFLRYKKPQAAIALKFYDDRVSRRPKVIPKEEIERREGLRKELQRLHKAITFSQYAGSESKRIDPQGM